MFGILILNKPAGPTSRDCINRIDRLIHPVKCGHAGTLDPIASGVLIVMLGQAVRLTDAIHSLPKEYIGQFQFGVSSESLDTETDITNVSNAPIISRFELEQVLPTFTGTVEQMPPKFSAVWIDGTRAHELARQGKEFDVPKRTVFIDCIELVSMAYPNFELRVRCSTGTYIRSLARDIARRLGTQAIMTGLQRTSVGPFVLSSSVALEALTDSAAVEQALQPAKIGVEHLPQAYPSVETLIELIQGKLVHQDQLNLQDAASVSMTDFDSVAAIDHSGELKSLVKRFHGKMWRANKCFEVDFLKAKGARSKE